MSMMMDLAAAAKAMNGTLMGDNGTFSEVSTDSRKLTGGELFIALRCDNFDGHEFIAAAKARGAAAAVVDSNTLEKFEPIGLPLLVVANTRLALGTPVSYTHLDVYKRQMESYAAAKERLFSWPRLRLAVINLDDRFGRELVGRCTATRILGYTQSDTPSERQGVIRAENVEETIHGLRFTPVSYTHLDVYKRQCLFCPALPC